jgi:hypothetical protein
MPLLRGACPSFASAWTESLVDNADVGSPTGRLGYLDAADFIRHLVALRLDDDTEEFPGVFEVIERLVRDGDEYTSNLAVIGYLEGLQMVAVTGRASIRNESLARGSVPSPRGGGSASFAFGTARRTPSPAA